MIRKLTIDEVIALVQSAPEQSVFDWKSDFTFPIDEETRGEFIKDLAAIANGCESSYGFIVYGVNPQKPDPILGITQSYDDAKLQQLVKGKIKPTPTFVYYEVSFGSMLVGVVQVSPTRLRPHIISVDLGKVRNGQIPIRRGSCTDGVTLEDLQEFFYGQSSGYFPGVVQQLQAQAQGKFADVAYMRELREQADQSLRDMESISGLPRGTLG
jgi:predicted HTH transcriptional regulator